MREILEDLKRWKNEELEIAVATVVSVSGSGPRPVGSKMAVTETGKVAGSVSGGCVESAVIEEALRVMEARRPRLLRFGISDETAWQVGLSCGGEIEVWVEPFRLFSETVFEALSQALEKGHAVALVTSLQGNPGGAKLLVEKGGNTVGSLGSPLLETQVLEAVLPRLEGRRGGKLSISEEPYQREFFVDLFRPQPRLIVVGAGHLAIPLIQIARILGFWTVLVDPRSVFANRQRFPDVDQLLVEHPAEVFDKLGLNGETAVVAISHDEKIDIPALALALGSPAGYIGALGSRKTHAKRIEKLKDQGISSSALTRIHAPIGLHLGGDLPEEIALAVLAEIVAVRYGKDRKGVP